MNCNTYEVETKDTLLDSNKEKLKPIPIKWSGAHIKRTDEIIINQDAGRFYKISKIPTEGRIILTNKRLVFSEKECEIDADAMKLGVFLFNVPLVNIVKVSNSKKGSAEAFAIKEINGRMTEFVCSHSSEWISEINRAIAQKKLNQ